MKWKPDTRLATQVGFLDFVHFAQLGTVAAHLDFTVFQHIATLGNAKRCIGVLLHQNDGNIRPSLKTCAPEKWWAMPFLSASTHP